MSSSPSTKQSFQPLHSSDCDGVEETTMDSISNDTISQDHVVFKKQVENNELMPPPSLEGDTDDCCQEVDVDENNDDESKKKKVIKIPKMIDFQLAVLSNMVFMIAAVFFLAMEITGLAFYRLYDDTPRRFRQYKPYKVRWNFVNETGASPEYSLCNTTEEYSWRRNYNHNMEWYNRSVLDEEELGGCLFHNAGSNDQNDDEENSSSALQFMLLYFCGALGFLITGMLDLYVSHDFWSTILHITMILAASFGMMSALLVNKDEHLSIVLNSVSLHLFAFEALPLITSRWRHLRQNRKGPMKQVRIQNDDGEIEYLVKCLWIPKVFWVSLGDAFFVIGAVGDVVLSYFFLLEQDDIEHAYTAVVFSVLWVLSASLYLTVNSLEMIKVREYYHDNGLHQKSSDVRKIQSISILLVAVAALVAVVGMFFGLDTTNSSVESTSTGVSSAESTNFGRSNESDIYTDDMAVLENCTKSMLRFSDTTVVLTMSVMSAITAIEEQYVADVFSIIYQSMLRIRFGDEEEIYCDPYCRDITKVIVVETRTTNSTVEGTFTKQSSTQCDAELYLTFSIEGTYWACENMLFPGLFSRNGTNGNAAEPGIRWEEPDCPACPHDPNHQGFMAPSESSLLETMTPFVTVSPAVCELLAIETLDAGI